MPNEKNEKSRKNISHKEKLSALANEITRSRCDYGLLAPFLILFLLFVIVPIIAAVLFSFTEFGMPGAPSFTGFDNFRWLFTENEQFYTALKNTLFSLLITGLGGFLLITLAAWLVSQLKKPLKTAFAVIFSLPSFLYGGFAVWGLFTGENMSAPLNGFLMSAGLISTAKDWLSEPVFSLLFTQLIKLWGTFGIGFLAVLCGFEKKDRDLCDSAKIDGASNRISEFFLITVHSAAPYLAFAGVLQIAAAFSAGSVFTTAPENMTLTDYMLYLGTHEMEIGLANAVGVLITAASLIIYFIVRKLFELRNV